MPKHQSNDASSADAGPLSPPATWASAELMANTKRVWSAKYGRPVGEAEAMKILSKAGKLFKALYPELDGRK